MRLCAVERRHNEPQATTQLRRERAREAARCSRQNAQSHRSDELMTRQQYLHERGWCPQALDKNQRGADISFIHSASLVGEHTFCAINNPPQ